MPYNFVPPGYQAVLLGPAANVEELGTFATLEASSDEGALFILQLELAEQPDEATLIQLEEACREAGIERWPGYQQVVFGETGSSTVYMVWQKGMPWLAIIGGILVTVVLPPLLGSLVWMILPKDIKNLITSIINMGMLLLIMYILMQAMKPLISTGKPKKVEKPKETKETGL